MGRVLASPAAGRLPRYRFVALALIMAVPVVARADPPRG
jgi:hypothetical protein